MTRFTLHDSRFTEFMDFEPKQFGKYYLLKKLAVGGMAEIYKAKTFGVDGFEKELVIKRILPHCSADKDFISMLIDEAKLSVMLSHANVVQVYDLGKVGDDYFISMEFIHGVNLRDIMYRCREDKKPVPVEVAVYIISEICKGLDYAHRKTDQYNHALNIVHRDVSPQNILISYEGEVKIVDFGIAKAAMNISHTMAGILKGKIAYMSPEQAMGKPIDGRTDIFSAGILLYEMLTGTKLFTGETQFEVLKKIRTSRVTAETLPDSIPALLKPTVAKALAFSTEDRFQSAGDLQIELTRFLYSSYSDFSPRRLSIFIRNVFEHELTDEQIMLAQEAVPEHKTSSLSFSDGVKQIEIVHREIPLGPKDDTVRLSRKRETSIQTIVPGSMPKEAGESTHETATESRTARRRRGIFKKIAAAAVVAATLFAAYKYIPAVRFWEKQKSQEMRSLPAETSPPTTTTTTEPQAGPTGTLNIITDPPGAAILIDGKLTGLTAPAMIEKIPLNTDQRITLSKPDYEDFEQVVNLTSARPQKISTKLKPIIPQTAKLVINSTPSGATVLIDGKETGRTTPATIANLAPARYTVALSLTGYQTWTGEFEVRAYESLPVDATLVKIAPVPEKIVTEPQKQPPATEAMKTPPKTETPKVETPKTEAVKKETPKTIEPAKPLKPAEQKQPEIKTPPPEIKTGTGTIKISTDPPGADVFVNQEHRGKSPLTVTVPAGTANILINKEGLARITRQITVNPGQTIALTDISLTDIYGQVTVTSDPPKATVIYDGQVMPAPTPVNIKKVKRDVEHTIVVKLSGFHPWTRTFTMDEAKKVFNVTLQPE